MEIRKCLLAILTMVMPIVAWAEQREYTDAASGVIYTYDTNGTTAAVKAGETIGWTAGSPNAKDDITILSNFSVDGKTYTVTSIGDYAFYRCNLITSVYIPNTIQNIGIRVFDGCQWLVEVQLPEGLKNIPRRTFCYCYALEKVNIPDGVTTIDSEAFYHCAKLNNVTFPASIRSVAYEAFRGCGLTSLYIPKALTSIGESAFVGCENLNTIEVESGNSKYDSRNGCNAIIETASNELLLGCANTVIPEGITSIGHHSFSDCTSLTSISIPASVKVIKEFAFASCTNLTMVNLPDGLTTLVYGAFWRCSKLQQIELPQSLTAIGPSCFFNTGLISIKIPKNVTSIPGECFKWCYWLVSISLPEQLTSIGYEAFNSCYRLTDFTLPNKLEVIDEDAFSSCELLTEITLPASLTTIGSGAFRDNPKLQTVTSLIENPFPIDERTFSYRDWLGGHQNYVFTSAALFVPKGTIPKYSETPAWNQFSRILNIGDEIGESGEYTDEATGVVYVYSTDMPTATVKAGDKGQAGSPKAGGNVVILDKITVDGKDYPVTSIGNYAFYNCQNVISVSVPASVTTIGDYAFSGCRNMVSISLPDELTTLKSYALEACESLSSFKLPKSIQVIDYGLLADCTGLKEIDMPEGVTTISTEAFTNCTGLESVYIPASVSVIGTNGLGAGPQPFSNCTGLKSVVVSAANKTFDSRDNCNAIIHTSDNKLQCGFTISTIPPSVEVIGNRAFICDRGLKKISIPGTVKEIEEFAFYQCGNVEEIELNEGLQIIGDYAFHDIKKIKTLHIPASVTKLYSEAFSGWEELESISVAEGNKVYASPNNCNAIIEPSTKTLIIGCKNTIIPDGIRTIGWCAFEGRTLMTNITIPNSVKRIETAAFYDCFSLISITIPASVTYIGEHAFRNNLSLSSVTALSEEPAELSDGITPVFFNQVTGGIGGNNGTTLYVPKGCIEKYKAAPQWGEFARILEINTQESDEKFERKVVVEEGTGTWCGWCPRGIVGINSMLENHPDDFIPIGVHVNDEMEADSYKAMANIYFNSYPSCIMNREYTFDPNAEALELYYQLEQNRPTVASIKMGARWANEENTSIDITTTTRFAYDMDDDYRIAYVITENNVGPYSQANYYSGGDNGEMGGFEDEPSYVTIMHNHVARYISDTKGTRGTVPDAPLGKTDYEYTYTLTLPTNIQNKKYLELIVLLINRETELIENADKIDISKVLPYDPAGIADVKGDVKEAPWYDMHGHRVTQPIQKGIYIRDGRKVVVR